MATDEEAGRVRYISGLKVTLTPWQGSNIDHPNRGKIKPAPLPSSNTALNAIQALRFLIGYLDLTLIFNPCHVSSCWKVLVVSSIRKESVTNRFGGCH